MRISLPVVVVALLSSTVPVARSQANSAGAASWDASRPEDVKRKVEEAFLNEVRVRVLLNDETSIEGKITSLGSDEFTIAPRRSEPATVEFGSVRRLSWQRWHESKAARIRYKVKDIAAQPNLVATARPRHQTELAGRIGEARALTFVLVDDKSGVKRELAYRDVDWISAPGFRAGPSAGEVFQYASLVAAGIVLLPLTIFMALLGWDGC